MKNIIKAFSLTFLLGTLFLTFTNCSFASAKSDLTIYIGKGCPHCAKVEEFVKKNNINKSIKVIFKEVYFDKANRVEFLKKVKECGLNELRAGVPMLTVAGKCMVGDASIINFIKLRTVKKQQQPVQKVNRITDMRSLTLPLVVGAASVDAINPCAFAVLIVLMTTVLLSKKRHEALFSGLIFILAIFISYFLMGLGIYKALASAQFSGWFIKAIVILAFIIGIFNIKDYFNYGGLGFKMEVPDRWRPALRRLITSVTSPIGAFSIGFLVSLFLLPCTSGPYLVILGMLSQKVEVSKALLWLLLYNLIFVFPMIVLTLVVYRGMSPSKLEKARQEKLRLLHLVAGLIMIGMGIFVLLGI